MNDKRAPSKYWDIHLDTRGSPLFDGLSFSKHRNLVAEGMLAHTFKYVVVVAPPRAG